MNRVPRTPLNIGAGENGSTFDRAISRRAPGCWKGYHGQEGLRRKKKKRFLWERRKREGPLGMIYREYKRRGGFSQPHGKQR